MVSPDVQPCIESPKCQFNFHTHIVPLARWTNFMTCIQRSQAKPCWNTIVHHGWRFSSPKGSEGVQSTRRITMANTSTGTSGNEHDSIIAHHFFTDMRFDLIWFDWPIGSSWFQKLRNEFPWIFKVKMLRPSPWGIPGISTGRTTHPVFRILLGDHPFQRQPQSPSGYMFWSSHSYAGDRRNELTDHGTISQLFFWIFSIRMQQTINEPYSST